MKKTGLLFIPLSLMAWLLIVQPAPAGTRPAYTEGLNQARRQADSGNFAAAERTLHRLARQYPKNPEVEAALGRLKLWQKDYAGAARLFRQSLARKKDATVRQDLGRAEALQQLAIADRVLAAGETAGAEKTLRELFEQNRLPYESGSRLGQLYQRLGQPARARAVFLRLRKAYPAEADFAILAAQAAADMGDPATALAEIDDLPPRWQERVNAVALQVRLLTALGSLEEALRLLGTSPAVQKSPELRELESKVAAAVTLQDADALVSSGANAQAALLLRPLWAEPATRYDAGIRLGRIYTAQGDFGAAYEIYRGLAAAYPAERDFARLAVEALAAKGETGEALNLVDQLPPGPATEALRGRLLYRLGDAEAALQAFRSSLSGQEDPGIRRELAAAETAALLSRAELLALGGDAAGAARIWQELESTGRETYKSGYRLGMAALAARNFAEARERFARLTERYPAEPGLRGLYLETLILNREEPEAGRIMAALPPAEAALVVRERPDLPYRIRSNNLKLAAGTYSYSGDRPAEWNAGATLSQRLGPVTGVVSGSVIRRFGLTDNQIGMEVHAGLGSRLAGSGYLAATVSPDASFLPRYTVGGEYYRGWRGIEGSFGLFRLSFRNSDAHILIPGFTLYPADTISLNERVYVVVDTGAVTSLTTVTWDPDYRFRCIYGIGIGNAAERFTSSEDTSRFFTLTNRLAGEYRITPAISVGGELAHEYRRGLYTRTGGILFGRYWW